MTQRHVRATVLVLGSAISSVIGLRDVSPSERLGNIPGQWWVPLVFPAIAGALVALIARRVAPGEAHKSGRADSVGVFHDLQNPAHFFAFFGPAVVLFGVVQMVTMALQAGFVDALAVGMTAAGIGATAVSFWRRGGP